jgi:hypothetical protein
MITIHNIEKITGIRGNHFRVKNWKCTSTSYTFILDTPHWSVVYLKIDRRIKDNRFDGRLHDATNHNLIKVSSFHISQIRTLDKWSETLNKYIY